MKKKQVKWGTYMIGTTIGVCLAVALGVACLGSDSPAKEQRTAYLDAAAYQQGFLAVGTKGRIAEITQDGTERMVQTDAKSTLNSVSVIGDTAVAAGDNGTVVRISGGRADSWQTGNNALHGVCMFNGSWLFGTEDGKVIATSDFQNWQTQQLPVKGNLMDLTAGKDRCMGVTDQGEIAITTDGRNWTKLDYNEYYSKDVSLTDIEWLDGLFWALGTTAKGNATAIVSLEGGVWTERELIVMEQTSEIDLSDTEITSVCSDGEQQIAAMQDGRLLTMPSCVVCNKVSDGVNWTPWTIAQNQGKILIAGDGYQFAMRDVAALRQERIQPEAAREKQQAGAVMIDVRGAEDYAEQHIAGSINLPVDQVADKLPALYPDRATEIIFYCASGQRSQTALETARSLGYLYVYNLGGLSDWPYEKE